MNKIVLSISSRNKINPTLFFSKKNQKEFIRSALNRGSEEALKGLTSWRRNLIREPLKKQNNYLSLL